MKKVLVITVGLLLLALPALTCGSGASGSGGAGNTPAVGAGCSDGWEAVRLGSVYRGVHFEIAGDRPECLADSNFCASFQGQLHSTNVVEAAWGKCGSDAFSIPGHTFSICTMEGWVSWRWDGQSNHVCVKFEPY